MSHAQAKRTEALLPEELAAHLSGVAAGDEQSLARLYDRTAAVVHGIALRMLRSPADAEEVVTDVYSYVWRNAATWQQSRGSVLAWLSMLCRSRCVDRIRSQATRASVELSVTVAELEGIHRPASDPWQVRSALDRLEPAYRNLLELAFYAGLTHPELAQELGLPLGTVKTRIRAAIARMRDLLKERTT